MEACRLIFQTGEVMGRRRPSSRKKTIDWSQDNTCSLRYSAYSTPDSWRVAVNVIVSNFITTQLFYQILIYGHLRLSGQPYMTTTTGTIDLILTSIYTVNHYHSNHSLESFPKEARADILVMLAGCLVCRPDALCVVWASGYPRKIVHTSIMVQAD